MATATQVPRPGAGAALPDIMRYQDELVRTGQYEYLGKGKVIVLEASAGANVPDKAETKIVGVRLDWYNEPNPKGGFYDTFLPLAQSLDHTMLLALGAIRRRDGLVGLPKIPQPGWTPRNPTPEEVCPPEIGKDKFGRSIYGPGWQGNDPPMVDQPLEARARGIIAGTKLLVFGPVHQILFQPVDTEGHSIANYWTIAGLSADGSTYDHRTNSHLEMVINAETGGAWFYGGAWQIIAGPG